MFDPTRKHAIVYVETKSGKEKAILMLADDAKLISKGKHSKIDQVDVARINWNPSIGEIRYARSKGMKYQKPEKAPGAIKLTCKKCGKKFYDERTVREKFIQETVGMPGAFYCKKCWKEMTGK